MPDKIVLDSSVIAAIFFREEASQRAEKATENKEVSTVDIAAVEVGNVAWKRVVFFDESSETTLKALKNCISFINTVCHTIPSQELLEIGFEIAITEKITLYDALFVAASEKEKSPLFTLDKKLYEKINEKRNIQLV
ncbi:MAG: type II toxin-antitoxin system VapC family toxin [Candidatus Methanofastidiosia archaeon]|jgi:predicted nucleic acid-binding protein